MIASLMEKAVIDIADTYWAVPIHSDERVRQGLFWAVYRQHTQVFLDEDT